MLGPIRKPIAIQLSGGVSVESGGETRRDFATSRNRALVALLALRKGSLITRDSAIDLIWPDADPEAGRNRLSTALVQVRKLLSSTEDPSSTVLHSDRTHLWLDEQSCGVDSEDMATLLAEAETCPNRDMRIELLENAFERYRGPLAPEVFDEWALVDQIRFGEIAETVTRSLIEELLAAERAEEARRVLHKFKRLSGPIEPDGWTDHVAMPERCEPFHAELEQAYGPATRLQMDFGALSPDSPFYIERDADRLFRASLAASESIILTMGPRQIGKTSLLARGIQFVKRAGGRCAFTDFQKFPGSLLADEAAFYLAMAESIAHQIDFDYPFEKEWKSSFGLGMNLEYFMRAAIESAPTSLCWFIDEGDKLFWSPYAGDFYGLIRSWHNARALDFSGPWSKLTIVISYSTEAHLFIKDLNQSPFNVGRRLTLPDFSKSQVQDLNQRLDEPLNSEDDLDRLMALVGGHPFLIRRSLNRLVEGTNLEELLSSALDRDGPFSDHLNRVEVSVNQSAAVRSCLEAVLTGKPATEGDALYRLLAAGVLRTGPDRRPRIRNMLYKNYLSANSSGEPA